VIETCAPPAGTADGTWHWLVENINGALPEYFEWRDEIWFAACGVYINTPTAMAERFSYGGPVSTPAEVAALRERIADLEGERDRLRGATIGMISDALRAYDNATGDHVEKMGKAVAAALAGSAP
jgi:hypothetical protein